MSPGVRIVSGLLVLVAALVQVTIINRIEIVGASPDLLILVVMSIALLTGSVSGAAHGFLAGVAVACFAAAPLGPHALVGTLVGYVIGRVGEALITDDHPIPPLLAGVFAVLAIQIGQPLVEFLVDPAANSADGLITRAALATLISAVLAVPVFLLTRRILSRAQAVLPAGGIEASA